MAFRSTGLPLVARHITKPIYDHLKEVKVKIRLYSSMQTGHLRAQVVSHPPVVLEAYLQFQASQCRICGGKRGTGTGFLQVLLFSHVVSIILPVLHARSFMYHQWYMILEIKVS